MHNHLDRGLECGNSSLVCRWYDPAQGSTGEKKKGKD
jgi:hypothetical protein